MLRKTNIKPDWFTGKVDLPPVEPPVKPRKVDALLNVLFAPSPDTGFPNSQISIMMGNNTDTEIKQFINDNLQFDGKHISRQDVKGVSDDTLFQTIEKRRENRKQYLDRLEKYARDSRKFLQEKRERESLDAEFKRIKSQLISSSLTT